MAALQSLAVPDLTLYQPVYYVFTLIDRGLQTPLDRRGGQRTMMERGTKNLKYI